MGYDWSWSWGMGLGMGLMAIFWVAIIAGAIWLASVLLRPREHGPAERPAGSGALRILEERLARGEIDVDEFRARRAALG